MERKKWQKLHSLRFSSTGYPIATKTAVYQKISTLQMRAFLNISPRLSQVKRCVFYRQFFWLRLIAHFAFPVSQWHLEARSSLQRRDRVGLTPTSLLSLRTCNIQYKLVSLIVTLTIYFVNSFKIKFTMYSCILFVFNLSLKTFHLL